jgi:hypothetical protein
MRHLSDLPTIRQLRRVRCFEEEHARADLAESRDVGDALRRHRQRRKLFGESDTSHAGVPSLRSHLRRVRIILISISIGFQRVGIRFQRSRTRGSSDSILFHGVPRTLEPYRLGAPRTASSCPPDRIAEQRHYELRTSGRKFQGRGPKEVWLPVHPTNWNKSSPSRQFASGNSRRHGVTSPYH